MAHRKTLRQEALVIGHTKLGEQDLILTLLCETGEKRSCVAKGARKPGGRLAARTELFSRTDFLLAVGKTLDIVSEAQVKDAHVRIRGDMERLCAASVIAECARLVSFEDVEDPYVFAITDRALRACEEVSDQAHLDLVVAAYVMKVLGHSGWMPELDACIACGDAAVTYFSPSFGGALCSSCAKSVAGAERVGAPMIAWIRALIRQTFDALEGVDVDIATSTALLGISHRWAATHLEARLKAFEFMLSL